MPETTSLFINVLGFVIGLLIIVRGSDLFLDNAIWLARASGVPQIVIGATVVSVCTTMPELVSSCTAALKGSGDIAIGNAIGSVICNTGLILGTVLFFITARVNRHTFAIRGVFLLGSLFLVFLLALPTPRWAALLTLGDTGPFGIGRAGGIVLLLAMLAYLAINFYETRQHGLSGPPRGDEEDTASPNRWSHRISLLLLGGLLVGIGAFLLVEFGQRLARNLGVSEAVISLVFVAFGTSLPELFTAISAVRKNAEQISVGNILGANVLNVSLVTGVSAAMVPLRVSDPLLVRLDMPVAFCLCGLIFVEGLVAGRIGRKTGILLVLVYVGYLLSMLLLHRVG